MEAAARIDHKLFRIVREARKRRPRDLAELARRVAGQSFVEFSYQREGERRYAGWRTVRKYAGLALTLELLDAGLEPAGSFADPAAFRSWLGDRTMRYMQRNRVSATAIRGAIQQMLRETPPRLPVPDHVHRQLGRPVPRETFLSCLKIVALLRPGVLALKTRRLVVAGGVVKL
ncbi:MAG: hypothetical protein ACYTDU_00690 [Planctomycetota bacterium]